MRPLDPVLRLSAQAAHPGSVTVHATRTLRDARRRRGDRLSNPPLNLFDATLMAELRTAVDEAASAAPRALIVRAEGKVFTAGVDVHVFEGLDIPAADALTGSLLELAHTLEDMPFPTIAAVHGLCLTAGLEVSLACDLLWASEGARFGLVERVVGITPLMGGTQRMAERAGTARAREFVYSGALYDAPTMHAWGVVNRVLAEDDLLEDARAFAARAGRRSHRRARRHEGDRARPGRSRHARGGRAHGLAHLTLVRDRRFTECRAEFPAGRPGQGHIHR